ncbi:hypothetical protein CBR_g19661 [Chara braunii]|uniref:tRNA-guanine(15) transglycosylase-like domain-containing protein n=1 Tax=Chara braunii TaxID=69332 RepID=A0A388KYQ0_CHABU|nr:hypothetical protein CBR_g19661 [Chara braunii]|eukprot:GBG75148.1 hypothetical protein CBR_g19661 [Chara braunii]
MARRVKKETKKREKVERKQRKEEEQAAIEAANRAKELEQQRRLEKIHKQEEEREAMAKAVEVSVRMRFGSVDHRLKNIVREESQLLAKGKGKAPEAIASTYGTANESDLEVLARWNRARASLMMLPHFDCHTPMFMPVGTQGTVKGLTTTQLEELGCQVILGNTYHLENRPGSDLIYQMGGLHKFMNWRRGMLTDSGGFQMVSLLQLAEITEEGVTFQSPVDGTRMLLTPEASIQIQNKIGADIIMALDDVVSSTVTGPRVEEAMHRTLRWIDRCIKGRDGEDTFLGFVWDLVEYAIGGVSGGEAKEAFWRVVEQCTAALPENKPRYVMGVGYPLDILVCSALGADMYDCVYPTRTARFGTALIPEGVLKLKLAAMATDLRPIDPTCDCMFTEKMRNSIIDGSFPEFVRDFLKKQFPAGDVPQWVCNALAAAGIQV